MDWKLLPISNYPNSLAVVSQEQPVTLPQVALVVTAITEATTTERGAREVLIFSEALSNENVRRIEKSSIGKWKIQRKSKIEGPLAYLQVRRTGRKPVPQRSQPRKGRQHQRKQQGSGREVGKVIQFTGTTPQFPIRIRRLQPSPILQHGFPAKLSQLLDRAVTSARRSKAWTRWQASRGTRPDRGRSMPALIHFWPGTTASVLGKTASPSISDPRSSYYDGSELLGEGLEQGKRQRLPKSRRLAIT